ncbi:MAG: hypothetical protein E3K37_10970 [Candidatus Kuenenia sp.]|nr:hypothetical protein [Candidatus Kuenenia hertensis]
MKKAFILFIFGIAVNSNVITSVFAGSPPIPTFGTATVDGDGSEWDLTEDYFADLKGCQFCPPDSPPDTIAKLFLRYDCDNQILYAYVKHQISCCEEGFWPPRVEISGVGNLEESAFTYYRSTEIVPNGWEASFSLSEGIYYLNAVASTFTGGYYFGISTGSVELVVDCDEPTAVELALFTANAFEEKVLLEWETATEIDNAGFNIYRAKRKNGDYEKINDEFIEAEGDATSGASYSYIDILEHSGRYFYKLEDLDTNGKSIMHGPIRARVSVSE